MNEKQYVQHISGQGEKWEVSGHLYNKEQHDDWQVESKTSKGGFYYHYLPKSEYRLCDPPEVWRDVTEECEVHPVHIREDHWIAIFHKDGANVHWPGNGYRLRMVQFPSNENVNCKQWAFIIEKKES